MKDSNKGFSWFVPLLVILLVVIWIAALFGVYGWQHKKVTDLNNQVAGLNSQISSLNVQVANLSKKLTNACQPAQQQAQPNQQPQLNQQASTSCTNYSYTSVKGIKISVYTPAKDSVVSSPIAVSGAVPGNWSFEAQFPVKLEDSKGSVITQATAHVLGNWQTTDLVPFSAQLTYSKAVSGNGTLVLEKDNPSGLSNNGDSLSIPVRF